MPVVASVHDVSAKTWDGLANPQPGPYNPLVSHAFFSALEDSGSAAANTGWAASHIVLEEEGKIVGLAPCYAKSHSQGEYVFDHAFADAYHRAGGRYYPKLQCSVPFSPVTGPRLLATRADTKLRLFARLQELTVKTNSSSAHITFLSEQDWNLAPDGWLKRQDIQFHWFNNDYGSYADFLATLSSSKRKNLRKEREAVAARGITFQLLTGDDIKPHHWDFFFDFYMDTGSRKWGRPYLTREFFARIHATMRPNTLLVMATRDGKVIAGALNFIGSDRLFGRNWGCLEDHPFLHFETCYYRAVDFAIEHKLKVVEAGAQGEHKLARGYLPVKTYSLHYFAHPGLSRAVADYLEQERRAVDAGQTELAEHAPFKKNEPD